MTRGAEVLDDDVGRGDQLAKHRGAARVLEIEAQAALVAVQVLLVRRLRRRAGAAAAGPARRSIADHAGAPVGEQSHRRRAGARDGEIEHRVAGERQRVRHGYRGRNVLDPPAEARQGEEPPQDEARVVRLRSCS